jgi:hypothetical protein
MIANKLIKTLATKPETIMGLSPENAKWVLTYLTDNSFDGTFPLKFDPLKRTQNLLHDLSVRSCQFFDFGFIGNETIKLECFTGIEAFYEGFIDLPANLCFMEHVWECSQEDVLLDDTKTIAASPCNHTDDSCEPANTFYKELQIAGSRFIHSGYLFYKTLCQRTKNPSIVATEFMLPVISGPDRFYWNGVVLELDYESDEAKIASKANEYRCIVRGNSFDMPIQPTHMFDPLMTMLGRLNAQGVERISVDPPEKVNVRRRKRGLPELVKHTTVKIAPYRPPLGRSGTRELDSYTPKRYHFRRGHVRHFHNGEKTWVRPCFVGTPEDGKVEHTYVVQQ